MALSRKFLSAMGIEPEKIDEIIAAHAETVDALKTERDQYKDDTAKLAKIQDEYDKLKAEAKENAPYKEKYEKEHEAFEAYKSEQTTKETKAQKQAAYKELLKQAGVSEKHLDWAIKHSKDADIDSIEIDEKGHVKDSKKRLEAIKEDWSSLIETTEAKGAQTATPPSGNGTSDLHGSGYARAAQQRYYETHYGVSGNNNNQNTNNGGNG